MSGPAQSTVLLLITPNRLVLRMINLILSIYLPVSLRHLSETSKLTISPSPGTCSRWQCTSIALVFVSTLISLLYPASLIWAVVSIAMSRLTLRMENIKSQVISQIHPDDTKGGYLVASLDSGESSPTFVWSQ